MKNDIVKPQLEIHRATVCLFIKQARATGDPSWVYLAIKGDKIGKGFRNGYGGKIEPNETPRQCTAREVHTESGGVIVDPKLLRYMALGEFVTNNENGTKTVFKVNFFLAEEWIGEFRDTPEMFGGAWYPVDRLPTNELMLDNREWLGEVLKNNANYERSCKSYLIEAVYGPRQESLLQPVILTALDRRMEID